MRDIRFAFLGSTRYSEQLLLFLIKEQFIPKVIFSIPKHFHISYSEKLVKNANYADLSKIAKPLGIKHCWVDSVDGQRLEDYQQIIKALNLDILLVLGWYYMIPKAVRALAKCGAWGIHASLLPKYRGGAPLSWAMIEGQRETGVTLFKMAGGVDDGDIISQRAFTIEYEDTIESVYAKATAASKILLKQALLNFEGVEFTPQTKGKTKIYPQRSPKDGEIDLTKNSVALYNFIRGQSHPYFGAYIKTVDGKKLVIEKARIED